MAYVTSRGEGPFSHLAGEHCLNQIPDKAWWVRHGLETNYRHGRPVPTKTHTVQQLEAMGYRGLYLKRDDPLLRGCVAIDRPSGAERGEDDGDDYGE